MSASWSFEGANSGIKVGLTLVRDSEYLKRYVREHFHKPCPKAAMSGSYVPLLILFGVSVVNALGMGIASHILNPRRPTPQKSMAYESGMIPVGDTRLRFSVKFYMVAISFIVFDLETIFLIPWAVEMRELGWGPFVAVGIFVAVLALGLIYEWKKGGLEWD